MRSIPIAPRFAITEQHGAGTGKMRLIDDFKAIAINDLVSSLDTDIPDGLDAMLEVASFYHSVDHQCQLRGFSVDFQHAYKHIPIDASQADFAYIAISPPSGKVLCAELRSQPFGSTRAPANWGRVAAFVQWMLSAFFSIYLAKYADGCYSAEPKVACASAFYVAKDVCNLLGYKLEMKKERPPMASLNLQGATLSLWGPTDFSLVTGAP